MRRELDERLRKAAAGALEASATADPSLQRYGAEVWARCEALTAGLASELTEQLRLVLEPTLASKMAGDYKTGEMVVWGLMTAPLSPPFPLTLTPFLPL